MTRSAAALLGLLALGAAAQSGVAPGLQFRDVAERSGIRGATRCGGPAKTAVIEVNGTGACWLDYNGDGLLDLYVVNGSTLEALRREAPHPRDRHNYLYRNNGDGTFTDVAEQAGVAGYAWGTGCAAADYDNDGRADLFVSNVGDCFLFHNNGDGTFTDVAKKAGVAGGFNWHTGATFGDYDGDGWLDLYVAAYLDPAQMLERQKKCAWRGLEVYCGPPGMKGAPDVLYHSNRDGTFTDVTRQAGVEDRDRLFGFAASFEDFDNDGRIDIVVANDRGRNYLYHNAGGGRFEEIGEVAGIAYPTDGRAQANMGLALGDYDRNGTMDVLVTTFSDEVYTLYRNSGRGFVDVSIEAGLSTTTLPFLGWGAFFADLDNDGRLDLFVANGHVYREVDRAPGFRERFAQRALLFRQGEAGRFLELGAAALAAVDRRSSRGAAYADFDNDGDLDILYTNLDAPPTLLENVTAPSRRWLTIRTVGTRSNRDGIGARIRSRCGDLVQYATVRSGESYLSGNDPRVHFGLGTCSRIDEIEVRWPSGAVDRSTDVEPDQFLTVVEGKGIVRAVKAASHAR